MTAAAGVAEAVRMLDGIERRAARERRAAVLVISKRTLVPPMRELARRSPGRAGPLLARFTTARAGRGEAVVIGPRTGKTRAWWRHFFITGTPEHEVGKATAARAVEVRGYASGSAQYAAAGGVRYVKVKARQARASKFLTNRARFSTRGGSPFQAMGPVTVDPIRPNPFVIEGAERGEKQLVAEYADWWTKEGK